MTVGHETAAALEVVGLHKNFGALRVARDISFTLEPGARHALIGPNGAGKTTLVNLITGVLRPTSGSIHLGGVDITRARLERRVVLGLARTFQISSLFLPLSVAENVALAVTAKAKIDAQPYGPVYRRDAIVAEVQRLLALFEIEATAQRRVADLAYGQRRLVELALALALKPKVLLLDEPAAGLPKRDSERLLEILMRLPAEVAVLVIEHDMELVFNFARRITVMFEGGILAEGSVAEIRRDPRVRDVYLGHRRDHEMAS
jgi:branched-chain amino acid transport system ATP-binding protein